LKLLHIINNLAAGGAEKLILETLPLFREKGVEVHLLLLNNRHPAFYDELVKTACCPVYVLGSRSVYNPLLIFRIIPYLRRFPLVHVHLFPALYWTALAKMISFSRVKLCFTEHSTTNRRRSRPYFKLFDRIIYRQYARIVTISPDVDDALRSYLGAGNDRIRLIPNGINLQRISSALPYPKADFFSDDWTRIVIQVSRFYEPKDQATLIRALRLLPVNVKLMLVGEGGLLKRCRDLVKSMGLEERVMFLGIRMDVPRLLKTADIVVLSSGYEGLSLACLEGMASGRPFVASDVPGITDTVAGAGILFPVGDEHALAREIETLLSDEKHYRETISACLARAAQYDISVMAEQYIRLWEEHVIAES
jgi:glycosyltransferase involved in cell wall biosynthesis